MAKKKTDDKEVFKGTTPIGTITYSHLTEPDYDYDKVCGSYNVKLRLSAEEIEPILSKAKAMMEEEYEKAKAACKTKLELSKLKYTDDLPIKPELNDEAEETGCYILGAKMKASGETKEGKPWTRRPVIYDAAGEPVTDPALSIWGGTKARVAFEISPFNTAIGVGFSCRLAAVQIIELVSSGQRSAESFGFDAVEGGYVSQPTSNTSDPTGDATGSTEADTNGDF